MLYDNEPLPEITTKDTTAYFYSYDVCVYPGRLHLVQEPDFFPENNKLYIAITLETDYGESDISRYQHPFGYQSTVLQYIITRYQLPDFYR